MRLRKNNLITKIKDGYKQRSQNVCGHTNNTLASTNVLREESISKTGIITAWC